MSSLTQRLLARQGRTFYLLSLLCAALYAVSAVRAVLPEVCASQRLMHAAYEQAASDASVHASHACCKMRLRESDPDTPSAPANCAFCMLAKAVVEPLELYRVVLAQEEVPAPVFADGPTFHSKLDLRAAAGRAPPVAFVL